MLERIELTELCKQLR